jgi:sugar O-acyltransferase (sialic acid O-acetyltransferase NeuD family)
VKKVVLIGYSGHGYVACDIFNSCKRIVEGYCDLEEKKDNFYELKYLGKESTPEVIQLLKEKVSFVAIGENLVRGRIIEYLLENKCTLTNGVHSSAVVSPSVQMENGIMIGANAVVNAFTILKHGVICNTGSIIEHECELGINVHIAPGTVLLGNVKVGDYSFIGANSVVLPHVKIGKNVVVGSGTVVLKDIPDNSKVVGNPNRYI